MDENLDITTVDLPPFCIDDMEKVEWLLRKLGNIEAEKKRVQAQAAAMVQQLDTDAGNLTRLFGDQLQAFVREELARRGGRRKSLTTLQGTCAFRLVPGGIRLTDPAAAFQHVKEQTGGYSELITLVEKLNLDQYRALAEQALNETGELLPGMEDVPDREAFSVKFGPKE